jgi:hypothetical protein
MLDGRKITIEELDSCLENHKHLEEAKKFLTEAIESGAEVYFDRNRCFDILARVPEMEYERSDKRKVIGIYMTIFGPRYSNTDKVFTWIAVEDSYGIKDDFHVGEYASADGYKTVLNKAITVSSTCDFCHKYIGLKDLKRVGFANKACKECYPAAKKELEYSGWTS